jgi:hypothetical protein
MISEVVDFLHEIETVVVTVDDTVFVVTSFQPLILLINEGG